MSENVNFSDIDIAFDQNDIAKAMTRPKLPTGWLKFLVTGADAKISKVSGNMMVKLTVAPVDEEGNTRRPTANNHLVFPLPTPRAGLIAVGLGEDFVQKVPDTLGLIQGYLHATRPEEFPRFPKYDKSAGLWVDQVTGDMLDKEEKEAVVAGLISTIYTFLKENAWKTPGETFVDDTFYAKVTYKEDSEWPNLGSIRGELPADEVLADIGE